MSYVNLSEALSDEEMDKFFELFGDMAADAPKSNCCHAPIYEPFNQMGRCSRCQEMAEVEDDS